MKRMLLLSFLFLAVNAQVIAQPKIPLKKVMELKMPKTVDDDMPGTRGASIAWHPVQKKYYASFAGNVGYPMGVFDDKAKRISNDEQTTMIDTRGLWYNPVTKLISGNAYSENGWFSYTLDKAGIPTDVNVVKEGMNQPDAQSVGVYNPTTKQVLFLKGSVISMYDNEATLQDATINIHWGRKKSDGIADGEDLATAPEDYNYTSLVYTGIKGQELGFLNITNKEIELYDMKTGFLTKILGLPETAVTESSFNFTYANGIYWLFNIEMRKWVGYK